MFGDHALVAVQAGPNARLAVVQTIVTRPASAENMAAIEDVAWKRMDRALLEECGYVDRTRQRLKYEVGHPSAEDGKPYRRLHEKAEEGVFLLDGPRAGEHIGRGSFPRGFELKVPIHGTRKVATYVIDKVYDDYFGLCVGVEEW